MKRMIQFLTAAALCACMLSLIILPAAADGGRSPGRRGFPGHGGMRPASDSRSSRGSSEALAALLTALVENGTITDETYAAISALLPQADDSTADAADTTPKTSKQADAAESGRPAPRGRGRRALPGTDNQADNPAAETSAETEAEIDAEIEAEIDAAADDQAETASILDEETLVQLLESGILTQEEYDSLLCD